MATKPYMKKFINLTSRVINKSHIVEIIKCPNKYDIHMSNFNLHGLMVISVGSLTNNPILLKYAIKKINRITTL